MDGTTRWSEGDSGLRRRVTAWQALLLAGALALTGAAAPLGEADAQDAAQEPARGITVIGYGLASAPAETAELQMIASQTDFGPPRAPDPGATPGAEEREAIGPMVDSLIDAGVPEDDIEVVISPVIGNFYGPGGPGIARVDVNLPNPTTERITELINAGTVGAAEEDLVVELIGVGYGVADCAPLQRQSRAAALTDAQTRAGLQADLMGLNIGGPIAASDVPLDYAQSLSAYYGATTPTDVACSPPAPAPTSGSPVSVPPFDPTGGAEVTVYSQVAVTYEIVAGTGATPAA